MLRWSGVGDVSVGFGMALRWLVLILHEIPIALCRLNRHGVYESRIASQLYEITGQRPWFILQRAYRGRDLSLSTTNKAPSRPSTA